MSIFRTNHLESLDDFANRSDQLAIVERHMPENADVFFQKLMTISFGAAGKVHKASASLDIREILRVTMPLEVETDPFYGCWIDDMSELCEKFCDLEKSDAVGFWLGSQRGCRRYHIDQVPQRMLVTYAGKGTEWLPDEAADRHAFANGAPNEKIVKDRSARQFLNQWDVAVFRGGPKGL